jgi:hypothetical protein
MGFEFFSLSICIVLVFAHDFLFVVEEYMLTGHLVD